MKRILSLCLLVALSLSLAACASESAEPTGALFAPPSTSQSDPAGSAASDAAQSATAAPSTISVEYQVDDLEALDATAPSGEITAIRLEGDGAAVEGSGATVEGTVITITASGSYRISGTLFDGQILVDTSDPEVVGLILDNVDITCSTGAPIYVLNAEKTVITLAENSQNVVTDGPNHVQAGEGSQEPNAAIFSCDDLTINGSGSLTVNAGYNNGIASKDDLKITGGTITVIAVNDGIKGKDSIAIKDGLITITAGADGLQAHNETDAQEGFVSIEGGALHITAGLDGVQAATSVLISGGELTITAGGGAAMGLSQGSQGGRSPGGLSSTGSTAESTKGVKAAVDLSITGGALTIDSADDALHANGSMTIDAGELLLNSGDDGMHADATLVINGGTITITRSYEGIESAAITINDGLIHVLASDDGINAAGGNDGSSIDGRMGQNPFDLTGDKNLHIHGGTITVDAVGDGLDINGPITMTGGAVIINGPTSNVNGALDYAGEFKITGGYLLAVGSAGMTMAPSASSTQYSVILAWNSTLPAGTLFHIEAQDGREILTFAPTKAYQSLVLSTPELESGATYLAFAGGSSTGASVDGLYSGGSYSGGTEIGSFTVSGIVTGVGATRGGSLGGGPGRTRP